MVGAAADNSSLPISQSLEELQDAADRIFDAITNRVGSQLQQLKDLSARIESAQAKVDAISGSKRATTIYSSAKFPQADPSLTNFVSLFEDLDQHMVSLDTGQWQSQEEGTLELFQFFSETSHEYWLKDHKYKDGIGKVPPHIKSVADVLLFNSTELPYHKYRVVDNLAGADPPFDQEELEVKPAALPAAPQSVLSGEVLATPGAEEFGFRPVLRQVPTFSLPSFLPDLPMVADISWSGMTGGMDQLSSIAPSAVHGGPLSPRSNYGASPKFDSAASSSRFDPASFSTRLDGASSSRRLDSASESGGSFQSERKVPSRALPPLDVITTPQERTIQPAATRSGSGSSSSSSASSSSGSNKPSSSPIPQSINVDVAKVRTPPRPPPPPPLTPPPSLQSSPAKVSRSGNNSSAQVPLPPIDTQRAALMASIRNSGLSLLRKTGGTPRAVPETVRTPTIGNTGIEGPEKISSPDVKQPISVMAEMARSLTLRRLSMRGGSHVQGAIRNDSHASPRDEGHQSSGLGDNSKLALPNLQPDIAEKDEEQSDDDDWE